MSWFAFEVGELGQSNDFRTLLPFTLGATTAFSGVGHEDSAILLKMALFSDCHCTIEQEGLMLSWSKILLKRICYKILQS